MPHVQVYYVFLRVHINSLWRLTQALVTLLVTIWSIWSIVLQKGGRTWKSSWASHGQLSQLPKRLKKVGCRGPLNIGLERDLYKLPCFRMSSGFFRVYFVRRERSTAATLDVEVGRPNSTHPVVASSRAVADGNGSHHKVTRPKTGHGNLGYIWIYNLGEWEPTKL